MRSVARAAAAVASMKRDAPSAVVLDVGLPDGDGIALCRQWRAEGNTTPILMLTARTDVSSRVEGIVRKRTTTGKPFALSGCVRTRGCCGGAPCPRATHLSPR